MFSYNIYTMKLQPVTAKILQDELDTRGAR